MDTRKAQLLEMVVEEYIHTAQPVGSKILAEDGELDVSGATIRNELHALEEEGFLTHPHTSSGRVPTETGYRYYVENFSKATSQSIKKTVHKHVQEIQQTVPDQRSQMKAVAKCMAEWTNNAAIVVFETDSIYYTGISYLFSQPEFRDYAHAVRMTEIFDQCEERVGSLEESVPPQSTRVFIGKQNPLGSACSSVVWRPNQGLLFLIVGPMRMDYKKSQALFASLEEVL